MDLTCRSWLGPAPETIDTCRTRPPTKVLSCMRLWPDIARDRASETARGRGRAAR